MPPVTDLEGLKGEALTRAVRRAAWHPWRDAQFWRSAATQVAQVPPSHVAGRDLAQMCLAFRRIQFASPVLAQYCERYFDERRQALNTFELAAVLLYFAAARIAPESEKFAHELADEVCNDWRHREVVPWTAWRMLVTSLADMDVSHQKLFEAASPQLAQSARLMNGRDAVAICEAYAAFRFKHHGLLSEVAKFLPSMGLRDGEVWALHTAFAELEFDAPLLHRIRELRGLGGQIS